MGLLPHYVAQAGPELLASSNSCLSLPNSWDYGHVPLHLPGHFVLPAGSHLSYPCCLDVNTAPHPHWACRVVEVSPGGLAAIFFFLLFYYSYVHTRLGSFLPRLAAI
jgi:hypothetical protein